MRDKRGQKKMALKNASSKAVACVEDGSGRELPAQEQKAKKKKHERMWLGSVSLLYFCIAFFYFF
jgi:hypothetical protein